MGAIKFSEDRARLALLPHPVQVNTEKGVRENGKFGSISTSAETHIFKTTRSCLCMASGNIRNPVQCPNITST
jgi:hypothetical protein